jgi:hypothetical protein
LFPRSKRPDFLQNGRDRMDPDQIHNLIDASEHRGRIVKLRAALDAHMLAVNDNEFIPESAPLEAMTRAARLMRIR